MPAHGSILLREVAQHLSSVGTSCNFCPRRGLAQIVAPCGVHMPGQAGVFRETGVIRPKE